MFIYLSDLFTDLHRICPTSSTHNKRNENETKRKHKQTVRQSISPLVSQSVNQGGSQNMCRTRDMETTIGMWNESRSQVKWVERHGTISIFHLKGVVFDLSLIRTRMDSCLGLVWLKVGAIYSIRDHGASICVRNLCYLRAALAEKREWTTWLCGWVGVWHRVVSGVGTATLATCYLPAWLRPVANTVKTFGQ